MVKAVKAGIKLAGDVSSRIRTGVRQRVQALRNVLRVPPEKQPAYGNSYGVDSYTQTQGSYYSSEADTEPVYIR